MTRPIFLVDMITRSTWFRRAGLRRLTFIVLIVVLGLLCVLPRKYEASVKLAPQQANTAGLGSVLGQLGGNYSALLGGTLGLELDLAIGRSFDVKTEVARSIGLVKGADRAALDRAVRELDSHTDVQAIRGNVIEVTAQGHDRAFVELTVRVFAGVMQRRLAQLSRAQPRYRIEILNARLREAGARLSRAEAAVTAFRRTNQLVEPQAQFGSAVAQLNQLRASIESKQVELQTVRQFNSERSFPVQALRAQIAALQRQLAASGSRSRSGTELTASTIAPKTLEFERLNRELQFAQTLYDAYRRYIEGAALEDLTADFNMQIIENPFVDPKLKFNVVPLALVVVVLLLAIACEFIVIRPPVGSLPDAQ